MRANLSPAPELVRAPVNRVNHVRYESEGTGEEAISTIRVTNRVGLVDLSIEDVAKRIQQGEIFETWYVDKETHEVREEPLTLMHRADGGVYLHGEMDGLTALPRF